MTEISDNDLANLVVMYRAGRSSQMTVVALEELQDWRASAAPAASVEPIPMRLTCPTCGELHIDEGVFATKPHRNHACQECGAVWQPSVLPTVGVRFLPGYK